MNSNRMRMQMQNTTRCADAEQWATAASEGTEGRALGVGGARSSDGEAVERKTSRGAKAKRKSSKKRKYYIRNINKNFYYVSPSFGPFRRRRKLPNWWRRNATWRKNGKGKTEKGKGKMENGKCSTRITQSENLGSLLVSHRDLRVEQELTKSRDRHISRTRTRIIRNINIRWNAYSFSLITYFYIQTISTTPFAYFCKGFTSEKLIQHFNIIGPATAAVSSFCLHAIDQVGIPTCRRTKM